VPLSSKFLTESTADKNCEKWSIFSEDMEKLQLLTFFGPPCSCAVVHYVSVRFRTRAFAFSGWCLSCPMCVCVSACMPFTTS